MFLFPEAGGGADQHAGRRAKTGRRRRSKPARTSHVSASSATGELEPRSTRGPPSSASLSSRLPTQSFSGGGLRGRARLAKAPPGSVLEREMSGPHHRRLNTELFITDEELVEVMERVHEHMVIW